MAAILMRVSIIDKVRKRIYRLCQTVENMEFVVESTSEVLNYNTGYIIVQRTVFCVKSTMELFIKYVYRESALLFVCAFEIRPRIACDMFVIHSSRI